MAASHTVRLNLFAGSRVAKSASVPTWGRHRIGAPTTETINYLKSLAGAGGFEPPDGGIKIRCLTAWLRPNMAARLVGPAEIGPDNSSRSTPSQRPAGRNLSLGGSASAGAQWRSRLSQDEAVERDPRLDDGQGCAPFAQRRRTGEPSGLSWPRLDGEPWAGSQRRPRRRWRPEQPSARRRRA